MHALALTLFLATGIDVRALEALLDRVIPAEMQQRQIPGAAFVLVQDGKVVFEKGYGFANLEEKVTVDTEKTIFPIASITKVFTATAVVQLADRGVLDLHADVNRYLKRAHVPATYSQPVTAAHLLTHTGGLDELRGRLVEEGERVQPLDLFLSTRLIRVRPPACSSKTSPVRRSSVTSHATSGRRCTWTGRRSRCRMRCSPMPPCLTSWMSRRRSARCRSSVTTRRPRLRSAARPPTWGAS
jgi:CubicO group peptidase (beta-lactamase class C family)